MCPTFLKAISIDQFLSLFKTNDRIACSIGAAQPRLLLGSLDQKTDFEKLEIFTGLLSFPYPVLTQSYAHVKSGYYGPIERMLNDYGANLAYLPLAFDAFEVYVKSFSPRVVMTSFSPPDEAGYISFGTNAEAVFNPFLEATQNPQKLAIAEVNEKMPRVFGLPELGGHKVLLKDLDAWVESDQSLLEFPELPLTEVESKIAQNVVSLIQSKDTLQFGIGAIPNEVARLLSESNLDDFGVHSELISDGFVTLMESGKISNRYKNIHTSKSLFTFALGSSKLYEWLDERNGHNQARALAVPVSYVNNPAIISKNQNMVSINSGFMIDLSGQVCSEAIAAKQYSGVGGQLNFVQGAFQSEGGRSIICIKSAVEVEGKKYSNIVHSFPAASMVSTPRHYVQYVVTEYGIANLYGLTDEERCYELIKIAHPQFRDELLGQAQERDKTNYHSQKV